MEGYLEKLRRAELEQIKPWFHPGMRVLEIGGGSGYQASLLASWACDVVSLDILERPNPEKNYYSVQEYDGTHIPFPPESFDIIFSSSVLEHIKPLPPIFTEMHRVLKPEGLVITILPSPSWRFWSSVSYYPYLLKRIIRKINRNNHSVEVVSQDSVTNVSKKRSQILPIIKQALFIEPHGEYPNALAELYYFSKSRWLTVFTENKFEIEQVRDNQLFYTGCSILPDLSLETRRTIARFFGSACHIYIKKIRKCRE